MTAVDSPALHPLWSIHPCPFIVTATCPLPVFHPWYRSLTPCPTLCPWRPTAGRSPAPGLAGGVEAVDPRKAPPLRCDARQAHHSYPPSCCTWPGSAMDPIWHETNRDAGRCSCSTLCHNRPRRGLRLEPVALYAAAGPSPWAIVASISLSRCEPDETPSGHCATMLPEIHGAAPHSRELSL